jgi:NAD(P)H-nitrite reductase large subunit
MAGLEARLARIRRFRRGLAHAFPLPDGLAASLPDAELVCRCEGVTAGALRRAVRELDAPEVNRAKAFCRVGMGRCQGRVCGLAAAEIVADARRVPLHEAGRLRGQAPVKPVPIAALAQATP